jgi:hypothetical protein
MLKDVGVWRRRTRCGRTACAFRVAGRGRWVVREPLECLADGCGLPLHEFPAGLTVVDDEFQAHLERLRRPSSTLLRGGNVVVAMWTRIPNVFFHEARLRRAVTFVRIDQRLVRVVRDVRTAGVMLCVPPRGAPQRQPVADALTHADQTIGQTGRPLPIRARMADILARHGSRSPQARAHVLTGPGEARLVGGDVASRDADQTE